MGRQLYYGWDELSQYHFEFKYKMFLLSFVPLTINFLITSVYFQRLLKILGVSVNLTNTFKVIFLSRLGKYIPGGGIWAFLGQLYLFDKENVSKLIVSIAIIMQLLVNSLYGLLVFSVFYFFHLGSMLAIQKVTLIFICCVCIFILHPKIFSKVVNLISFKLKGERIKINYNYSDLIYLSMLSLVDWLIFGVGLYFLTNSFYSVSINLIPIFTGAFAISWILGIYIFITPDGLGIREGVQAYLLSFFLPLPIAIIFSLMSRLWSTIGDLVSGGLAFLIKVTQDEDIKVKMVKLMNRYLV
ncbi:MAG: lysylphosphatidylglycerol synthase domain-containing protein [Thermodesulfobacteriota bacterium]